MGSRFSGSLKSESIYVIWEKTICVFSKELLALIDWNKDVPLRHNRSENFCSAIQKLMVFWTPFTIHIYCGCTNSKAFAGAHIRTHAQ